MPYSPDSSTGTPQPPAPAGQVGWSLAALSGQAGLALVVALGVGLTVWAGGWLAGLGAAAAAVAAGSAAWAGSRQGRLAPLYSLHVHGDQEAAPQHPAGHIPVHAVIAVSTAASQAAHGRSASGGPEVDSSRQGADLMVAKVVPVWARQLDITRDAAASGLAELLESFSQISMVLNALCNNLSSFSVSASPGAVDKAVRVEGPALEKLTAASMRAFAERDAALNELGRCAEGLIELKQLAKQSRELARHTRLVAFNASIEANRLSIGAGVSSGGLDKARHGGSLAVAVELRMLATRLAETAEKTERAVNTLAEPVSKARREGHVASTSTEVLQLEIDVAARQAMAALLAALGSSMQSSGEVKQAAESLTQQIEATFMHFQFGDRISQMLSIITTDMNNLTRWVASNPRAAHADAAQWLAALESSYTMDEQRSTHHGNVHVDQGSAVEFF